LVAAGAFAAVVFAFVVGAFAAGAFVAGAEVFANVDVVFTSDNFSPAALVAINMLPPFFVSEPEDE